MGNTTNRVICLPNELNEQLKKENNASGLIANLLSDHYKISKEDFIEEVGEEVEIKEKLRIWGEGVRESHRKQGRITNEEISEWMKGAEQENKWHQFLKLTKWKQ
jgi:hypothetical protein